MLNQQAYATERTRKWLASSPGEDFLLILQNIEKFGCHIMQVKGTSTTPGWSYSIGLYDTAHQPEIIAVGMPQAAAVTAINKAVALLREGVDLTVGRVSNIIPNRDAEFRLADPECVDRLMGRALFYYDDELPPTLQLLYPDLNNRFQQDPGFDERFRYPLLQTDAPRMSKDEDFWNQS